MARRPKWSLAHHGRWLTPGSHAGRGSAGWPPGGRRSGTARSGWCPDRRRRAARRCGLRTCGS